VPEPTPSVTSFSPQSATLPAPIPQEPASTAQLAPQEPAAPPAKAWPSYEVSRGLEVSRPVSQESTADPAFETPAPTAPPVIATIPTPDRLPEPAPIPVEASPVPSVPPALTPPSHEPSGVDLREIIRSASGVAPSAAERQPIGETVDQPAAPSTRPEPDYAAFDTPVSNRAASLGLALEAAEAAMEAEPPARRIPVMAIAIALVAVAAIAGGSWFALSPRGTEQVAVKSTPVSEPAATASQEKSPQEKSAQEKSPAVTMPTPPAPAKTAAAPAPAAARERAPAATPAPAPAAAASAQPLAAPPNAAKPEMPKESTPSVAKLETPKEPAPDNAPAPDAAAPTAQKPTAPSEPRLTAAETAALLSRGDSLFGVGDVASARLYYERAAEAGNGDAALRLGETYDPTFLERAKLRAIKGDLKTAAFWYRRAKELGVAEADILLKGIQTK
jgi:hypothetical protein